MEPDVDAPSYEMSTPSQDMTTSPLQLSISSLETNVIPLDSTTPTKESISTPLERTPTNELTFVGQRYSNKFGKPNVLVYNLPDGKCYSFGFVMSKTDFDYYMCNECKKRRGGFFRFKVVGDTFISNPLLNHLCTPLDAAVETNRRMRYREAVMSALVEKRKSLRIDSMSRTVPIPVKKRGYHRRRHLKRKRLASKGRKSTVASSQNCLKKIFKTSPASGIRNSQVRGDPALCEHGEMESSAACVSSEVFNNTSTCTSGTTHFHEDQGNESVEIVNVYQNANKTVLRLNPVSSDVSTFLEALNLGFYKAAFIGFSLEGISVLTPEELIRMGLEKIHAYCIYSTLKARETANEKKPSETCGMLKIYVAELIGLGGELVYKMVQLQQKTKGELFNALKTSGLVKKCVKAPMFFIGPAGIKVEISDEVVSLWKDESIFTISFVNGAYNIQSMCR